MIPKRVPLKIIEAMYKYISMLELAQKQGLIHHYELEQYGSHYAATEAYCKIFINETDYISNDSIDFYFNSDDFIDYPFCANPEWDKNVISKIITYFDNACNNSYTYHDLEDWGYVPRRLIIDDKSIVVRDIGIYDNKISYVEPKFYKADEETIFIDKPQNYSIEFISPYLDYEKEIC